eukprot:1155276-Pelagomonas_calceolata.AAC.4
MWYESLGSTVAHSNMPAWMCLFTPRAGKTLSTCAVIHMLCSVVIVCLAFHPLECKGRKSFQNHLGKGAPYPRCESGKVKVLSALAEKELPAIFAACSAAPGAATSAIANANHHSAWSTAQVEKELLAIFAARLAAPGTTTAATTTPSKKAAKKKAAAAAKQAGEAACFDGAAAAQRYLEGLSTSGRYQRDVWYT